MPSKFSVTIVGGGIGGLALAIMLEAAQIDYVVLERSSALKTLGSTIGLNGSVLRLLEQLGLWPEIQKIGTPIGCFHLHNDDLSTIGTIDFTFGELHYGYYGYVMSRPALFEILKARVPKAKVFLKKNVVDIIEQEDGALCKCADGTEYWGSILVGADGAYSNVRQKLYDRLREEGTLPASDALPLKLTHVVTLGVSRAFSHEELPALKSPFSKFEIMLFKDRPYSLWLSPIKDGRISWCYGGEIEKGKADDQASESFWEWSPSEVADQLVNIKDLPTAYGCPAGDIIGTTPKDLISSVILEEKFFETWHSKRVVLLGDACHKVLPFAGQGTIHAILDGVCLVNLLHKMRPASTSDFEKVFQTYHGERSGAAKKAVYGSRLFGHVVDSKGFLARLFRRVSFTLLPQWVTTTVVDRVMRDRPQLSFLPHVEDRGAAKAW